MKVLIACEYSGTVRDAFIKLGHDAISCDLLPTDIPGPHYQGDVFDIINDGFDLMIAHPPCTHLAVSGAKHFYRKEKEQAEALEFVQKLMDAKINKIVIENPVSVISSKIRKPDQIIQPWQFGEPFQKTTCLWLKNLPKLIPTKIVDKGEFYISPTGKKLPMWYSKNKSAKARSKTFQGIADAMAQQWGNI
jgi:site-specific DNA-cytosine methylase